MSKLELLQEQGIAKIALSGDEEFIIVESTENYSHYTYLEKSDLERLIQELTELKDKMNP